MDKTLAQLWFIKKSEFRLGFIISLSKFAPSIQYKVLYNRWICYVRCLARLQHNCWRTFDKIRSIMIKALDRSCTCRLLMVWFMLRLVVSTFSVIYWKSVGTGSSSTPFITAIGMFSRPLDTSLLNQNVHNLTKAELLRIIPTMKDIAHLCYIKTYITNR